MHKTIQKQTSNKRQHSVVVAATVAVIATLQSACVTTDQLKAAQRQVQRAVSEIDFKGDVTHDGTETRGELKARFLLRDPDRK